MVPLSRTICTTSKRVAQIFPIFQNFFSSRRRGPFPLREPPAFVSGRARAQPPSSRALIRFIPKVTNKPRTRSLPRIRLVRGRLLKNAEAQPNSFVTFVSFCSKPRLTTMHQQFPKPDSLSGPGPLSIDPGTVPTRRDEIIAETQTEMFDSRCTDPRPSNNHNLFLYDLFY